MSREGYKEPAKVHEGKRKFNKTIGEAVTSDDRITITEKISDDNDP